MVNKYIAVDPEDPPPPPSTLGSDVTLNSCLYHCLMLDYERRCRISTLIMVPISFWRNSDLFKKKIVFLAQKLTKLEHFKEKASTKIPRGHNTNRKHSTLAKEGASDSLEQTEADRCDNEKLEQKFEGNKNKLKKVKNKTKNNRRKEKSKTKRSLEI